VPQGISNFEFRISNFEFAAHPPIEPQRHRGTERRKHEGTKTQRTSHEDSPLGEVPAVVGRRPGTAEAGHRSERERSSRWPATTACTLGERRPRHSSAVTRWMAPPLTIRREGRRNRRAAGASAGGKLGADGRSRPEATRFPPVGGDRDRRRFCRQSRHRRLTRGTISLRPSRLCGSTWTGDLRAFVSSCLRRGRALCVFSVSLCLCG